MCSRLCSLSNLEVFECQEESVATKQKTGSKPGRQARHTEPHRLEARRQAQNPEPDRLEKQMTSRLGLFPSPTKVTTSDFYVRERVEGTYLPEIAEFLRRTVQRAIIISYVQQPAACNGRGAMRDN